jgi:hypothetical protein
MGCMQLLSRHIITIKKLKVGRIDLNIGKASNDLIKHRLAGAGIQFKAGYLKVKKVVTILHRGRYIYHFGNSGI